MFRALLLAVLLLGACSDYDLHGPPATVGPGDAPATEQTGTIRGRICGPDGSHWIVGAQVSVDLGRGDMASTLTDADGYFDLDLPAGDWDVVVTKGSFSVTFPVTVVAGKTTDLPEDECIAQGDLRIAVIPGTFDHVETLLDDLGIQYDLVSAYGVSSLLRDPSRLRAYDVLFFNCGMDDSWTWLDTAQVGQNLHDFVAGGGSIYASDWAYYTVEAAFPDMNTFYGDDTYPGDAEVGETGNVTAQILDPVTEQNFGSSTALINYDLPSWVVMTQTNQGDVLLQGTVTVYDYTRGTRTMTGPLASRMATAGGGTVLYTTFHTEAQNTTDMERLLQEFILSL